MRQLSAILLVLLTVGCGATRNPSRPTKPAPIPQKNAATVDTAADVTPSTTERAAEPASSNVNANPQDPDPGDSRPIIATVAGMDIDVAELLSQWLFHDSPEVHETLGELILSRFAIAEATRLELKLSPQQMERAYGHATEALGREVERAAPGESVDEFLRRYRGLDPDTYRERLREQSARALIAERVVRAWLLETDHVWARAIICDDQAALDEVQAMLDDGASFEEVAKEKSTDPSGERGGMLPPIVKTSESVVSRLAFATPVGERGGPIEDGGRFMLVEVVERPTPLQGNWVKIGKAVEASLDTRPVEPIEWLQWEQAMYQRYSVDTTPFLKMVGEPPARR